MRDQVAIVDLTAFAIFDVVGPGALDYIQKMAVNQMDVIISRGVYTPLLNQHGGFKADLTIIRRDEDEFRMFTFFPHGVKLKFYTPVATLKLNTPVAKLKLCTPGPIQNRGEVI